MPKNAGVKKRYLWTTITEDQYALFVFACTSRVEKQACCSDEEKNDNQSMRAEGRVELTDYEPVKKQSS